MHNVGKVIHFEVVRTLKKGTFWLAALSVPALMAFCMGLSFLMQQSSEQIDGVEPDDIKNILIKDATGYFTPEFAEESNLTLVDDEDSAKQAVKDGRSDLFAVYPKNPLVDPIKVFGQDSGNFDNGKYENAAKNLLISAVNVSLTDPEAGAILLGHNQLKSETTAYKDGSETSMMAMVVPLVCLAVLFLSIMMCSNTILVATTEEKENRITEMILTTIKSRTLIIGKISAQWILMLIQMSLLLLPIVGALVFWPEVLPISLADIPIDIGQLIVGIVLTLSGIALFTGVAFIIGAITPTAKEANSFSGVMILLLVLPIMLVGQILSDPNSGLVQFLTFFPLTSPMVILMRSAFETLPLFVPLVGIVISSVSAALVLMLASRIFQYGNLAYSRRLSVKEIISRRSRA